MKRKIFTLLALASFVFVGAKEMTIEKATKAPTIDGKKADWSGTWTNIDNHKTANTTTAFTAKFNITYDDMNLYVIAEVTGENSAGSDATAIPNSYERDCMEIFVSLDTMNKADNSYYAGVWQIRKQRIPGAVAEGVDGGSGGSQAVNGTRFNIISTGDGDPYYYEAALSWDTLAAAIKADATLTPWGGKMIKFDIQIADNTTGAASGRTQQSYWNDNSDSQWNNTSKFGLVKLKTPVSVKSTVVKNASSIKIKGSSIEFASTANVNVYDVTGKLVIKANNVNSISTAALKSGVYVVTANNESKKFIK